MVYLLKMVVYHGLPIKNGYITLEDPWNIPGLQHGHHDHGADAVHGHQRWRDGPGVAEAPETWGA